MGVHDLEGVRGVAPERTPGGALEKDPSGHGRHGDPASPYCALGSVTEGGHLYHPHTHYMGACMGQTQPLGKPTN